MIEQREEAPQAAPPQWERPDPKVLLVWRLSNAIGYAVFFLIVLVIAGLLFFFGRKMWAWSLLAAPLGLWAFTAVTLRKQWENWRFRVTPESLEMAHGWIWKQRRVVARDRIQHVDINSGPFDRRFGLVQVVVHTAGLTVGMIPGVAPERAERLRDELMHGRSKD